MLIGTLAGKKFGEVLGVLTQLLGREPAGGSPWTTWYEQNPVRATVMLARRRWRLNREQLFGAYPPNVKTGFYSGSISAPEAAHSARTPDGGWNDLTDPMAGAARTRFGFNTDPTRTEAETGERLLTPNPREVSRVLLTRKSGFKEIPFLNLTAAAWIQFMNHDWVSYGDPADAPPYRIPLAEDDPVRRALKQTHMLVRPTQTDPTRRVGEKAPTHINEVTSWWDGSQIYGSDGPTLDSLRSHQGGKLELDPDTGNLPVLADGVEKTGFRRNWWLGLESLAPALRQGAQRDLRSARGPLPPLRRSAAVRHRPARERRGDGQDPHRGVDPRRAAQRHAEHGDERQLVRRADQPVPRQADPAHAGGDQRRRPGRRRPRRQRHR